MATQEGLKVVEVYTTGELAKMLGLDRNRLRRAFKRILAVKGMDVEKFTVRQPALGKLLGIDPRKIHPRTGTILIPKLYVKELVEQLTVWEWEFSKENIDLTKLYQRSIIKGNGWGVLVFYDNRKRKVPVAWIIKGEKVFIGLMEVVPGEFYEKLQKCVENAIA